MRERDCELDCRHIADGKEIPACTHSPLEQTTEECLCLRYCTDARGEYGATKAGAKVPTNTSPRITASLGSLDAGAWEIATAARKQVQVAANVSAKNLRIEHTWLSS